MAFLVADISFRSAQADPRPESAGFAIVSREMDLDRQESGRGTWLEDRRCVRAGRGTAFLSGGRVPACWDIRRGERVVCDQSTEPREGISVASSEMV